MKLLSFFFFLLISINLVLAAVGTDDFTQGKVVYTDPDFINYSLVPTVNSSDWWDSLDFPNATQMEEVNNELTIRESWLTSFGNLIWCALTGCNMTGNLSMGGNNIDDVENLNVGGDANFTGNFSTPCMHCEDGDVYFSGDGFFAGNVTAPNIEVMESLIVHGNSTCTGTATACSGLNFFQCGWWNVNRAQYGCSWTAGSGGSCTGTATVCTSVSTALCENQAGCVLSIGSAGFIISGLGLTGNFSINTTGNGTFGYLFGDGSQLWNVNFTELDPNWQLNYTDFYGLFNNESDPNWQGNYTDFYGLFNNVSYGNASWNESMAYDIFVPYTGATDDVDLNGKNLTNVQMLGVGISNPQEKAHIYNASGSVRLEVESGDASNSMIKLTNTASSYAWIAQGSADEFFLWNYGSSSTMVEYKNSESKWNFQSKHIKTTGDIRLGSDSNQMELGNVAGGDATIGFNSADLVINSTGATANDEIHFTNFDKYVFDNDVIDKDGNIITGDNFSWNETMANNLYVPYTGANANVDLGVFNLTTTGSGTFGDLLTINQSADSDGIQINGYDDRSDEYLKFHIKENGKPEIISSQTLWFSSAIGITDDTKFYMGADPNYWWEYDNTNTQLELTTTSIDGVGGNGILLQFDDGTSNVKLPNDDQKLYFGAGDDVSLYYNASDMIINPREVGTGDGWLLYDWIVNGSLNVGENVTAENVFIPQYLFSHTNATIPVRTENNWTNITFDQEDSDIKQGINHTYNDNTNHTFMIMETGVYDISYDIDVEDTSAGASDIDVAVRLVNISEDEVSGSVFEASLTKQGVELELSHEFLVDCVAGEVLYFQFIADDADVQVSTHGTFGDHPESASVIFKKVDN